MAELERQERGLWLRLTVPADLETVSADPNNNNGTTSYMYDAVGNRQQQLVNGAPTAEFLHL